MIPICLALAAALCWGSADFAGGLASRRIAALYVVAIAHSASLAAVFLIALGSHSPWPTLHTFEFGLFAGLAGGIGLVFFFRALSSGHMGATTSVTGVLTAAVPVLYSLLTEGPPAPIQFAGFVLAAAAIWLIAATPDGGHLNWRGLITAMLTGIAFGSMLVLLRLANGGALWPLVASRVGSATVGVAGSLWVIVQTRQQPVKATSRIPAGIIALAVFSGLLDAGGNFLYTTSALRGRLDVAGVLSSLYPGVTILLAAWLLREHTTRRQAIGMGLAIGAVALISI